MIVIVTAFYPILLYVAIEFRLYLYVSFNFGKYKNILRTRGHFTSNTTW